MAKQKTIKIYTHHFRYLSVGDRKKKPSFRLGERLKSLLFKFFYFIAFAASGIFGFIRKSVFNFCFFIGNLIITPPLRLLKTLSRDLLKTRQLLPRRLKLMFNSKFRRALVSFFAFAVFSCLILGCLSLAAKALDIKNKILKTAFVGNLYLSQAKSALSSEDLTEAQNRFDLAYKTFNQGQAELAQSGQGLIQLLSLVPQKNDADLLLAAAGSVSEAGQNLINLEGDLKTLKISNVGINGGGSTAETFQKIGGELAKIQTEVTFSDNNVNKVDINSLPEQNRADFLNLKSQLNAGQLAINNFGQIFNLARGLLLGDKNILILFENNNELRATGGFIGTFGNLKMADGQITKINVSSIYDLDGQLTENIQPPHPILNVNSRWFLRDSNWFADFPTSAKKASDFYEQEGGETPDIVIALTPNLIIDWLKIIGPVNMPRYNLTLTADNFIEQTQAVSTISDDMPTNSPKQILADLIPVMLQKLTAQGQSQWPAIIQSIQDNLNNKQIVIYSRDQNVENKLEAFHWSGDLSPTDRDYLSVVSSNLGGTKTDLYVNQNISLTTTVAADGSMTDEVDITRTNTMPDLPDTFNESYIRVYAPLGSSLISNIGFDYKTLDYPPNQNYKIDNDVYAWEKNAVTDIITGTTIGQETGKTFFGNWLNLSGGQTKTVKLVYQLPFKLSDVDRYSLLLQKQIGSTDSAVNWTFNFAGRQINWKNFDTNNLNTDNLGLDLPLSKDYFLGMVLQKR